MKLIKLKIKKRLRLILLTTLIATGSYSVYAAEFVVLTVLDSGGGSIIEEISPGVFTIGTLRSAIEQAENEILFPDGDIISFDILNSTDITISAIGDTFDFGGLTSNTGFGVNSTITINGEILGSIFNITLIADQLRHFQVNSGGRLRLQNIRLTGGTTPINSAGRGGAIVVQDMGRIQLENCTIFGNAAVNGGAIAFETGAQISSITDSQFTGNSSSDGVPATENGAGGAIFATNLSGVLNIENTQFSSNDAGASGGALYINGLVNLSRSRILSNDSGLSGGGIYIDSFGTSIIANSIIDQNVSQIGGGGLDINSISQISKIVSSTIVENESVALETKTKNSKIIKGILTRGGGIFSHLPNTFVLHNTIIVGNFETGSSNDLAAAVDSLSSHNLIGVNVSTANISNGSNGNIIGTIFAPIDPLIDYSITGSMQGLQSNSPAIHAGSNDQVIIEGLVTDYRGEGFDRIYGPATDMGAFEFDDDFVFINGFE